MQFHYASFKRNQASIVLEKD